MKKSNSGPPFMLHRFQVNHKEQAIKPDNFVTLFILLS